jgi:twinkle protein
MSELITDYEIGPLLKRRISEETCKKFAYGTGIYRGKPVHIAPYYSLDGELVAQKLRFPGKEFKFVGDPSAAGLYGQQLWRNSGRRVVVSEGELDAMSIAQAFNLKWQAVSVPNGAQGAKKSIAKNLEWLEGFDEVVLAFDNDEPGRAAARECAQLFTPGRCKILSWPTGIKDASDMLQAGREGEVATLVFQAKSYRPDGILAGTELKQKIDEFRAGGGTYFSYDTLRPKLDLMTRGLRKGELVMLTAGTGIGKSTEAAELGFDLLTRHKLTIGYVALEENPLRTSLRMMSIELDRPLHLGLGGITEEEYERAYVTTVGSGRFYLYDHFGSLESDNLLSKLKFLANGCGCDFIVLDHISIAVSGREDGDERRIIDNLMTHLRSLVEQTGVGVIAICHLKKPQGSATSHEEGGRVTLDDLRGSGSIKQLSDTVIGIERNQQDKDESDYCLLRVLKCRFTGETGIADTLHYNKQTGRLIAVEREALTEFQSETKETKKEF